jgi:hypothetical protein
VITSPILQIFSGTQRWRPRILAAGQIMKMGFGVLLIVFGTLVFTGIDKRVERS